MLKFVFSISTRLSQYKSNHNKSTTKQSQTLGGSPGLVVMGGDSRPKGRGFESLHRILDGHFFTNLSVVKIVMFVLKRPKINEKRLGLAHF